jgi:nitroreductase
MDALEAIIKRRSVRRYTDAPVADETVHELCRIALLAPTDSMSQAWSLIAVTDPEVRGELAELVIRGGAEYFRTMRPPKEGVSEQEHAEWAREYAEGAIGSMRLAPVWIAGLLVPRNFMPAEARDIERDANMTSVGFMFENLMVAARAMGLGTVPMVFHRFFEDEFRALLGGIPAEIEIPLLTPLGVPEEFPTSLPPALQKIRRPWKTLVHRDGWDNPLTS